MVKRGKDPNDCWEWLGKKNEQGVGYKTYQGRTFVARRWLWELIEGPIPKGKVLIASCANPGCVNPAHMSVKFHSDACRNSLHSKLTLADHAQILAEKDVYAYRSKARGDQVKELCALYDITPSTVYDIWDGTIGKRVKHPRAGIAQIQEDSCLSYTDAADSPSSSEMTSKSSTSEPTKTAPPVSA